MNAPNRAAGYVPNPQYSQEDWDEVSDNPPLTDEELARARLGTGSMPAEVAAAFTSRAGRLKAGAKRVPISLRIDPDVLETFKATGPGWQTRMHDALAEAARKLKAA
ncbi:BrnA antitoxin family protein [Methylobacterium sp. SyP6R]|uniref:BrnA antitoxin family protein n=1 Tax=Methylobacterium sp. SyP6R TaxID=2718876 RepID=UPI001F2CA41E|nr:BrnA antitoxin family protein [Methylobacterium sp. SyP6R]MCF4127052.1 BrnA antitoxin family protein [Methylobacterium sp. SyP6R]